MNAPKSILSNVSIIRPILLVLLVFYHAFAIYSGAWAPIQGFPEVPVYWWLDKLSYAFMLEMFVFISGYVFGFQVRTKGEEKLKAKNLLWGKFKRLMIPCMVFSLLNILLFGNITQPIHKTLYGLVNGVGHMWFLPMLFWCFVGVWIIEKIHIRPKWAIPMLVVASLGSFLPLPFRIGTAMYYMVFFYVGFVIQRNGISPDWLYTKRSAIITTISFIIFFPVLTLLKERIGVAQRGGDDNQLVTRLLGFVVQRAFQLVYVSVGIAMTFSMVGCFLKKHTLPVWMEKIAALSFGVYLLQQFILKGFYDHTTLPSLLGCYWLPWVGFVVALFGSLLMAWLIRKTKTGQVLIG